MFNDSISDGLVVASFQLCHAQNPDPYLSVDVDTLRTFYFRSRYI